MRLALTVLAAALLAAAPALAQRKPPSPEVVDGILKGGFATAAPEWKARLVQDQTQRQCSLYRNNPPKPVADAIIARERATIVYPADGKLMGDWRKGEALAQSGYGGRFTDYPPRQPNGANCYACHQLDRRELSFGTLGPTLLGYGRTHLYRPADVKAVYERIYNPHSILACANMPRLGASGFLTIDQIKDLVAYVMSPESPVNK